MKAHHENTRLPSAASARSRRFRWIVVFAYVALIYTTIPYTSRLWSAARERLDVPYSTLAFYLLAPAGLIVVLIALRATRLQWWRVAGLAVCGGVYYALYGNIFQTPGEKIHLLEYGLLSFLVLWAVDERLVPPGRFDLARRAGLALLLAFLFGIWDETIQNYIPARHYDLRDIWINWLSSILGMIVCLLMRRSATAVAGQSAIDTVPLRVSSEYSQKSKKLVTNYTNSTNDHER